MHNIQPIDSIFTLFKLLLPPILLPHAKTVRPRMVSLNRNTTPIV